VAASGKARKAVIPQVRAQKPTNAELEQWSRDGDSNPGPAHYE
jgi:hypothetical protein